MSHTVVWLPAAEQELADLWLMASDRVAITNASLEIDQLLTTDPENAGESRQDKRRVLFSAPIAVMFRVLRDDRIVIVSHVWNFTKSN